MYSKTFKDLEQPPMCSDIRKVSSEMSVDRIYRTRSLGVALAGLPDQYADGKAARVWELYLGSRQERTSTYKEWFTTLLKMNNVKTVLDSACGTGVDSIMLLEEGFQLVSTDASDKMLKYALKERWMRRKEAAFHDWVIEEANWMTLKCDIDGITERIPANGFDAVICLGNSFAHLPDISGDHSEHMAALANMREVLKPGGMLVIDHRNYDFILRTGCAPKGKNVYYPSHHIKSIKTSNLYVDGKPHMITLDYTMDVTAILTEQQLLNLPKFSRDEQEDLKYQNFRLSYYPHTLSGFSSLVKAVFGPDSRHEIFGDFKPLSEVDTPAYYIHIVTK